MINPSVRNGATGQERMVGGKLGDHEGQCGCVSEHVTASKFLPVFSGEEVDLLSFFAHVKLDEDGDFENLGQFFGKLFLFKIEVAPAVHSSYYKVHEVLIPDGRFQEVFGSDCRSQSVAEIVRPTHDTFHPTDGVWFENHRGHPFQDARRNDIEVLLNKPTWKDLSGRMENVQSNRSAVQADHVQARIFSVDGADTPTVHEDVVDLITITTGDNHEAIFYIKTVIIQWQQYAQITQGFHLLPLNRVKYISAHLFLPVNIVIQPLYQ